MRVCAFIFARGGSKGLPGKNIRVLAGKPLIQYAIEVAQECSEVDEVFVSTENSQIAKIAESLGAHIINRPFHLASDESPEWLSWKHAVNYVQKQFGEFDYFVSLPTTSPLRSIVDVKKCINAQVMSSDADVCISVTAANRSPFFNMVSINCDGKVRLVCNPDASLSRRQDAPAVYDIATVVYCSTPAHILRVNGLFEGDVISIEVPKERAVDIDDIHDFNFAESILTYGFNEVI
jgi:CMP-N-acetylneuraminic acid synthetase